MSTVGLRIEREWHTWIHTSASFLYRSTFYSCSRIVILLQLQICWYSIFL